jgi:hypothetical protein
MSVPAIIYIVLTLVTIALWGAIHGRNIRVNVWTKLADASILTALLYWGGFFS